MSFFEIWEWGGGWGDGWFLIWVRRLSPGFDLARGLSSSGGEVGSGAEGGGRRFCFLLVVVGVLLSSEF